jgi:hypothetical protein
MKSSPGRSSPSGKTRGANGFAGIVIAIIALMSVSACTASTASKSVPQASKPSPSDSHIQLASLPGAQMPGSGGGFREIAAAQGTGNRDIGVFRVQSNAKLFFQLSCEGRSPVTIIRLYVVGPCAHGDVIATVTTTATSSRLVLTVQAPSKVSWKIYVSQLIPAPRTSPS